MCESLVNPGMQRQVCCCPPRADPPKFEDSNLSGEDPMNSISQLFDGNNFQVNDNQETANLSAPVYPSEEEADALDEEEIDFGK